MGKPMFQNMFNQQMEYMENINFVLKLSIA